MRFVVRIWCRPVTSVKKVYKDIQNWIVRKMTRHYMTNTQTKEVTSLSRNSLYRYGMYGNIGDLLRMTTDIPTMVTEPGFTSLRTQ